MSTKASMRKAAPISTTASNQQIIEAALESLPGRQKAGSNGWMMVCCPFHDDSSPSCGVRISEPNLGVFNCLACPAKGGWNKFAEKTGLPTIKSWNTGEDVDVGALISDDLDERLLGDKGSSFDSVIRYFRAPEATLWPDNIDWRGFPGKFMQRLGAHIVIDTYNQSVAALLPVKVAGQVRGGVKAIYEKDPTRKNALSYITSKGSWVADFGLFPFVYARRLIRRKRLPFVVLVEGPRDAMRLCLNGVPALAVLGAQNITKRKLGFVVSLGIDVIYVIPDPDDGGKHMWTAVKRLASDVGVPAKRIKLPPTHKDGSKMDPGNATRRILREVLDVFTERHDFEQPDKIQ